MRHTLKVFQLVVVFTLALVLTGSFGISLSFASSAPPSFIHSSGSTFTNTIIMPLKTKIPELHCSHQAVHLSGTAPAIVTCLHKDMSKRPGSVVPDIGITSCNATNNVTLFWDTSFGGDTICFTGSGFANLANYAPAWYNVIPCHCSSWNDQASGFALDGCALIGTNNPNDANYPGYFAINNNGNGQRQYFKWNVSKSWSNFTGQSGILPNDSLSSLYIDC